MADPNVPTAEHWECFDPEIYPPPRGATLWVVNQGGSGYKGLFYEGAIAWAYLPRLPASVKARQDEKTRNQQLYERANGSIIQEIEAGGSR